MANTLKFGNGEWYGKKDTILAYNDENSNYKPLPFDFSRASKATVINKDGLIEEVGSGQPRVNYKDDSKGALKLEPTRSNLITQSKNFLDSSWDVFRGSITANATISPDGTLNASRYQEDSQTGSHLFRRQSLSITSGLSYTGSIFVKKGELTSITLQSNSSSRWVASASFNLENGTVTSGTGVIENYGNGWYRCSISGNAVQTTTDAGLEMYTFVGAGRDGNGLFAYGAMFEQGSYATSYIPTSGSAVTRLAESDVSLSNLPIFDYTVEDFSISFKITTKSFDSVFSRVLSKASTSSGYEVFIENNGAIYFRTVASGVGVFSYTNPNQIVLGVESNITITRSGAVGKIYKDEIEITSVYANHSNISSSLSNNLRLGSYVQSGYNFSGQIKDVRVYNTALTDQELIALTS